jgi:hypothetical protein
LTRLFMLVYVGVWVQHPAPVCAVPSCFEQPAEPPHWCLFFQQHPYHAPLTDCHPLPAPLSMVPPLHCHERRRACRSPASSPQAEPAAALLSLMESVPSPNTARIDSSVFTLGSTGDGTVATEDDPIARDCIWGPATSRTISARCSRAHRCHIACMEHTMLESPLRQSSPNRSSCSLSKYPHSHCHYSKATRPVQRQLQSQRCALGPGVEGSA